ncbi:hypothetical protein RSOLAG1IB_11335 [Rhizoctonia solani AG-1 IB]|uniref:Uncharacterized protein n=1 Tax=Thanatephorus cucumeris (strain AG1-IB / isolate 7/3/14) TaxID=1108050 RepID=A0A0B7FB11_THACB|nr:hypothetical protein RSOLAG1IB_11335 [Rhizoctonia solani AG-1 IB]
MTIGPPFISWIEEQALEDAQRLRGGRLGCACCGDKNDGERPSPLEPQPDAARPEPVAQKVPTRTAPQLSQPVPPTQASQAGSSKKLAGASKSPDDLLTAPGRADTGRTRSSPGVQPAIPPMAQTRTRHQTLPSRLSANQPTQSPLPSVSPIPEDTIDYGGGLMRSPAFPPSVHVAAGSRKTSGAPPAAKPPFMKD